MNMNIWYIILGGCAVTLLPRVLPVMLISKINLNDRVLKFFKYIPISILTALVASELLISNNKFSMNNSVIIAAVITALVAVKKNNLLLTVIVGVISMAVLRFIF
ncbi:AzlD domain-containing protein (plasmid) [Clostridium estertheticum]|uniref:AzlD domain-containing protein n=1 Tax=Clostridium estertheticum TaxID=238834 RepID=UPI001C0D1689|nr:AzlD domain-containing protein [Clostridium estertheticum]MBU3217822.1 AzlD domain-containing protein [Clostridium estertheticum]WAG58339.1 AzlD domain-containing protein [Clostridium estertheticum]